MNYNNKKLINKSLYTLFVILINILFINIPVYGVKKDLIQNMFGNYEYLSFANLLTGNSLGNMSMGAFAIGSIVTANIVLSLLTFLIKPIENLQNDGEYGRLLFQKMNVILSLVITMISSLFFVFAKNNNLFNFSRDVLRIIPVFQWIFATLIISILCNKMRDRGIGEGISILLFTNISKGILGDLNRIIEIKRPYTIIYFIVLGISILICLHLSSAVIKIPLIQNNKSMTKINKEGYLPISISSISVMPIIYATSIINVPILLKNMFNFDNKILNIITDMFLPKNWYLLNKKYYLVGLLIYVLLIYQFSYISAKMTFAPAEVANRLKEKGDIIENKNPGKETENYIEENIKKICKIAFIMLIIVAIFPNFIFYRLDNDLRLSLTGTSLVIMTSIFYDLKLRFKMLIAHLDRNKTLY